MTHVRSLNTNFTIAIALKLRIPSIPPPASSIPRKAAAKAAIARSPVQIEPEASLGASPRRNQSARRGLARVIMQAWTTRRASASGVSATRKVEPISASEGERLSRPGGARVAVNQCPRLEKRKARFRRPKRARLGLYFHHHGRRSPCDTWSGYLASVAFGGGEKGARVY